MLTPDDWAMLARHTDAENAHQLDETLATLTPDCFFQDMALGTSYRGREEAAAYYEMWWSGLGPTVAVEEVHEIRDGSMVVAETVWRGQHVGPFLGVEPTNRVVELPVVIVAELRNGLLATERLYWDRATALAQIAEADAAPASAPAAGAAGATDPVPGRPSPAT